MTLTHPPSDSSSRSPSHPPGNDSANAADNQFHHSMTDTGLGGFARFVMPLVTAVLLAGCAPSPHYDLVIRNGLVLDGTGRDAVEADVAIHEGRFVEIGDIDATANREIDATGRYVTPGWIDMMDQSGSVLLRNGLAENKLLMGVTTAIGGEGGFPVSASKIPEYFDTLETQGVSLNFGSYYSVSQARSLAVGDIDVEVTDDQLELMKQEMRIAMQAGAVGMSSAAFYPPSSYIRTRELIEMGRVVAEYNGIYAAHMRDESARLLDAIGEMITVSEESGVDTHIFHLKNAYAPNWGTGAVAAIELINSARARGVRIGADQYPYVAGGTGIDATVPTRLFTEGQARAFEMLADSAIRDQLKEEILDPSSSRMVNNSGGWQNIVLVNAHNRKYAQFLGKNFQEIGEALNLDPADAAWNIMSEAYANQENGSQGKRAMALYFMMSEDDVKTIMQQPWVSIGSDAGAAEQLGEVDGLGLPHPRSYGTFPRIIAKYVREDGVLSLPEAIRKMTSLPASDMKLIDRGTIAEGNWADVVVFDYDTIQDNSTWDKAIELPTGIDYVLVNGMVVIEEGTHNGNKPGKVIYGPGYQQ